MIHDTRVIDLIERAGDARPFCACGRPTAPVWRDGVVWLDCTSLHDAERGRLRRLLAGATAPAHVHVPIVADADRAPLPAAA